MRSKITRHLGALFAMDLPHPALARLHLVGTDLIEDKRSGLPREFAWHDYAVYLLHIAAEIEHTLMVQYLYAAYSLGNPKLSQEQQGMVLRWQETILGIAKEEMGHFLTVQNILRLLGGSLNLDREDFPWDVPFYPYDFALEPISRTSLAKYIFAEAPAEWPSDLTAAEIKEIEAAVHKRPQEMPHRVGQLYELMISILSNEEAVADSVFREETVPFQASWDEWGRSKGGDPTPAPGPNVIVQRVSSRSEAVAALTLIARQGEWPDEDPKAQQISHFRRFLGVFREFPKAKARWSPTFDVPTNPQAPGLTNAGAGPIIKHPEASLWSLLFNIRYRMLLTSLAHSFRLSSEPMESGAANPRSMIINRTFTEMYCIRAIATILVQLPLINNRNPRRAGPPFQTPYSVKLPPDEADCWRVHLDLIEAAGRLLEQLSSMSNSPRAKYADALRSSDMKAKHHIEILIASSRAEKPFVRDRRSIAI